MAEGKEKYCPTCGSVLEDGYCDNCGITPAFGKRTSMSKAEETSD
ncbi:hypothetical protein ACFL24_00785 [Patescibacteria group bacterium]